MNGRALGTSLVEAFPITPQGEHPGARRSYLEIGVSAAAVRGARRHTRVVMTMWGSPELAEPAEHVVSELVTNAATASTGLIGSRFGGRWLAGLPPVRLWLTTGPRQVLVQVWDGNGQLPVQQDPDPGRDSGRGLWLVEALSEDWGAFRPEHASGKVVWTLVAAP
jgi:hypothetical protein